MSERSTLDLRTENAAVGPLSVCLPEEHGEDAWAEVHAYVHTPADGSAPYLVVDVDAGAEDTPLRIYLNDGRVYEQGIQLCPPAACDCYYDCRSCSLSGDWHVHPGEPCSVHPDAPGDA
jgi:hypothetical protein